MAKLDGIIKFTGTIDGITFYNSKYGWLARKKGGPDPDKMKTDKRFVRVRENGKEFGACGKAAGQVRRALALYLGTRRDPQLIGRLTKSFIKIKNMDTVSKRGLRSIEVGLTQQAARDLFKGFNFNGSLALAEVLKASYTFDMAAGTFSVKGLQPKLHIVAPKGATHIVFKSILVCVDVSKNATAVQESEEVRVSLKSTKSNLLLAAEPLLMKQGIRLLVLKLSFEQEINKTFYPIKSLSHSVLELLDTDVVSKPLRLK
ncbi:hypothetical protein CNR22_19560 [Sphingobacteriaceae bacterium]|nr:hypothetical protein CNR22_19560 [Sphingobacteriaceae bacterium]